MRGLTRTSGGAGRRRLTLAVLVAGVVALLVPLAGSPVADAAPRGNVVVFGDSFASNPPFFSNIGPGCHKGPTAWPAQLNRITSQNVRSFACANTTLSGPWNIYDQAAEARGVINKDTRAVLIQLGFNDFGGGLGFMTNCYIAGCPGNEASFPAMKSATFANRLRPLVAYVRHHAPSAKIALIGYPELYAAGQLDICTRLPGGAPVTRPGTSAHPAFMRKLVRVQKETAQKLGASFVDLNRVTKGHSMCAPQPWTAGFLYPLAGGETAVQGHPTPTGDRVSARAIKSQLGL